MRTCANVSVCVNVRMCVCVYIYTQTYACVQLVFMCCVYCYMCSLLLNSSCVCLFLQGYVRMFVLGVLSLVGALHIGKEQQTFGLVRKPGAWCLATSTERKIEREKKGWSKLGKVH